MDEANFSVLIKKHLGNNRQLLVSNKKQQYTRGSLYCRKN